MTVSLAVFIVAGVYATVSARNSPNTTQLETGNAQPIQAEGQLQEKFTSIRGLKQRASAIVEVNVINSETIVYKDTPFTISTAMVIFKVKGIQKEGQEIKLIETGGKYKLTGENPKEEKGKEVEFAFEGIRVMQPGDHLFLFVDEFVGPQIMGAYIPLGVYQGKFMVEQDGKIRQQAPNDHKLTDYMEPVGKEKFKENLK